MGDVHEKAGSHLGDWQGLELPHGASSGEGKAGVASVWWRLGLNLTLLMLCGPAVSSAAERVDEAVKMV